MKLTTKYTEEQLVSSLQNKQKHAFDYLYKNYSQALHTVIIGVVKDTDVAEEVLNDVFIKVWQKVQSYDPSKGRLYTWMVNIARNASIDKTRSKAFHKNQKTDSIDNSVGTYDLAGSTEIQIDHIGLEKFLGKLQPVQQKLIDLAYFQGYTQAEIAEEEEIPLGTVKTRIRKALIDLRQILAE